MKINKKLLFELVSNGKTEMFHFSYAKNSFDFKPDDFGVSVGDITYRCFSTSDEFEVMTFIRHGQITDAEDGFAAIENELIRFGAAMDAKSEESNEE